MRILLKRIFVTAVLFSLPAVGICQLKNVTEVISAKVLNCQTDMCELEVLYSYYPGNSKILRIGSSAYSVDESIISSQFQPFAMPPGTKKTVKTNVLRPARVTAFKTSKVKVFMVDQYGENLYTKFVDAPIDWPALPEPKIGAGESRQKYNENLLHESISIIDNIDYYDDDQLKVAKKYLEKIIFDDPKYTQAYLELARVAMKSDTNITERGKSKGASEAERILKTALSIDPNYANTYILYGYVLAIQNRTEEAVASFKRAQLLGTNNLWLFANWGLAYRNSGQAEQAIRLYSEGLNNIPEPTTPLLRSNARAIPVIFNNLEALYDSKNDWQSLDALFHKKARITHNVCVNTDHARVRLLHFSDIKQAVKMATIAYNKDCRNARNILAASYFSQWALDGDLTDDASREQIYRKGQAVTDNMQYVINLLASSDYTLPVLSKLKSSGVNIDDIDSKDLTPLAYAAIEGEVDVMKRLVKIGADPNRKLNNLGLSPLIVAVVSGQVDAVSTLVALGADPKSKAADGTTALTLAKKMGRNDIIDVLLHKNDTF